MALYDPQQHRAPCRRFAGARSWGVLPHAAPLALWLLGYPDQAVASSHEALTLAQELAHPFSLAVALHWAAMLHQFRREAAAPRAAPRPLSPCDASRDFALASVGTMPLRGWALAAQGQGEEGIAQIRQGLAAWRATGAELGRPYLSGPAGRGVWEGGADRRGAEASGRGAGDSGRTAGSAGGKPSCIGSRASCCWRRRCQSSSAEAEACFQQALAVARRQQAKSLELRAAMSLSRLWQQQGKRAEARQLLAADLRLVHRGL